LTENFRARLWRRSWLMRIQHLSSSSDMWSQSPTGNDVSSFLVHHYVAHALRQLHRTKFLLKTERFTISTKMTRRGGANTFYIGVGILLVLCEQVLTAPRAFPDRLRSSVSQYCNRHGTADRTFLAAPTWSANVVRVRIQEQSIHSH
jgi:hypothetical protein